MALIDLGQETKATGMSLNNSILVEIGGTIKRIELSNLRDVINAGGENILRQIAWCIPIKQSIQSSTYYGVEGNVSMWNEYKQMSGRYLVTNSGKAAKLSPVDSGYFFDGTPIDESMGHVMFISPRLYYLVRNDNVTGIPYLWLSLVPIGGDFIGGANNGMYNCIGAYKGSMSGNALVSRSGIAPAGSKTISAFWTAAQVNGKDWGLTDYDQRRLMAMFGLSEYGDTDIQTKLGYGVCGSSSLDLWNTVATLQTGATKSLGDDWGKMDISVVNGSVTGVNCSRVSMMGIEDPYGWYWEDLQGVYCGNSANSAQNGTEIFIYKGNRLPSDDELKTKPTGEYRQETRLTTTGFVKEIIAGDNFDIFASKIGGGNRSYWSDAYYANDVGQMIFWGGSAYSGVSCGLAYMDASVPLTYISANAGSRLAYYGNLQFVEYNNLN
ncbi:hypothetical protein [Bacteroides sp.]|uniref:hypothetical protein n=1 Tax=Bacteroides sp. TaxID=29523 RepID=UPI00260C2B69|nr:hypothetical protein [Bacteroides sp.]MDD3040310.1 hypothetical protein [Bacteroides sp.]